MNKIAGWKQVGAAHNGDLIEGETFITPDGQVFFTGWKRIAGFFLADGRIPEYNDSTGERRYVIPESEYEWR